MKKKNRKHDPNKQYNGIINIKFVDELSREQILSFLADHNLILEEKLNFANNLLAVSSQSENIAEFADALNELPELEFAEAEYLEKYISR